MKKIKEPRKLILDRETVRALSEVQLGEVAGGTRSNLYPCVTMKYGCDSGGGPCTQ